MNSYSAHPPFLQLAISIPRNEFLTIFKKKKTNSGLHSVKAQTGTPLYYDLAQLK
jgi:hypothetical protein